MEQIKRRGLTTFSIIAGAIKGYSVGYEKGVNDVAKLSLASIKSLASTVENLYEDTLQSEVE